MFFCWHLQLEDIKKLQKKKLPEPVTDAKYPNAPRPFFYYCEQKKDNKNNKIITPVAHINYALEQAQKDIWQQYVY